MQVLTFARLADSLTWAPWSKAAFGEPVTDRKSTRLNSSHANISYAVFCLKKKKMLGHHLHDLLRHREQGVGADLRDHLRGELLQHQQARVHHLVNAVPHAHDLLIPLDQIL